MELTVKFEDGKYTFFTPEGEQIMTEEGNPVWTTNEDLAIKIKEDAEKFDPEAFLPWSVLTTHSLACDYAAEGPSSMSDEDLEEWKESVRDAIRQDPILMFRQDCPIRVAIEDYFVDRIPEFLNDLDTQKTAAFMNVYFAYRSFMLSNYILTDIIMVEDGEDMCERDELIDEFVAELRLFLMQNGANMRAKAVQTETLEALVGNFVFYYTLDKVF